MINIQKGHDKCKPAGKDGGSISDVLNCFIVDILVSFEKVNSLKKLIFKLFNCIYSNK